MNLESVLRSEIHKAIAALFNQQVDNFQLQPTNQEFEGSHTVVCFPLTKLSKKSPEETAKLIGEYLVTNSGIINRFNVVKGFLNLVVDDTTWMNVFTSIYDSGTYGTLPSNGSEIMVEYSSPNTNKPLHLGHLRNNFLGWSVAEIYKANGYNVHKVQIINDRGIHICKSMAAWELFGNGETPQSSGLKGDHLVGKYYVEFEKQYRKQITESLNELNQSNPLSILLKKKIEDEAKVEIDFESKKFTFNHSEKSEEYSGEVINFLVKIFDDIPALCNAKKVGVKFIYEWCKDLFLKPTILKQAQELLRQWEAKDAEVLSLWKTMNGWVYEGFDITYKKMHVDFDKLYYESETYLLGKQEVLKGLESGVFFKKDDGSIWVDLTGDGLDQKVLLRSDGTSVYMTQDIGTAILRFRDFPKIARQVYTVGNEQEYHFKVLFLILAKLGYSWAKECYHLSYGMVDLPTGKMKSREGTVVDADDLIDEMTAEAEKQTRELGKTEGFSAEESTKLFEMIGLGALKFFLLKVDPKKRMTFDPNESIQLQGFTGPFIQYTHARIKSILRKGETLGIKAMSSDLASITTLETSEREVLQMLNNYENKLKEAAREYSPSVIANYTYELAKQYNQFYQTIPIFNEADQAKLKFRIALSRSVADVIKKGMHLLGIDVPERM